MIFSLTRQVLTLFQKPVEQQVRLFREVKVRLAFSSVQINFIVYPRNYDLFFQKWHVYVSRAGFEPGI